MTQQQVPYDREAEEATVGALLIDSDAMDRVMATGLRADDFHVAHLGLIFRAIMALHEQDMPGDYVLVLSELRRAGHLEQVGGPAAVTELILRCPTSIYAQHYAALVLKCAQRRRLIALAARVARAAHAGEDTTQAAERLLESSGKIQGVLR